MAKKNDYNGKFRGDVAGTPSTVLLQQKGKKVSGEVDAGGYKYSVSAKLVGGGIEGHLEDRNTGGQMSFNAVLEGTALKLSMVVPGSNQPVSFVFTRGGEEVEQTPSGTAQPDVSAEKDLALVGQWSRTDSMMSGDFTMSTQYFLIINQDGSYKYIIGKSAGGGPGTGIESSGGDVTVGEWKTSNRIVYIKQHGSTQWIPYGYYYVEPSKLMFKFDSGSNEIWYRN